MRAWDAFAAKHVYGCFLLYDDNHSPRVMSKAWWVFYCWYACNDFPARGDLCEGPFICAGLVRSRCFPVVWSASRGLWLFTQRLAYVVTVREGLESVFRGLAYIVDCCVVEKAFNAV